MALVGYAPISQFSGSAQFAIHSYIGSLFGQPLVASIEDWMSPGKFTREVPGSKLINDVNIPLHEPGMDRFDGTIAFQEMSNLFVTVKRGTYRKGTKVNVIRAAEVDLNAWSMAPSTMSVEIANNPYVLAVGCLNGAFTGVPQNASGIALGFPELINTDQIYLGPLAKCALGTSVGQIPPWVTSTAYAAGATVTSNGNTYANKGVAATSGATAPSGTTTSSDGTITWTFIQATPALNQVHPADSSIVAGTTGLSTWYNARQNWALSPDNMLTTIKNQQVRAAHNGAALGLGREGVEIWVPYSVEEDYRLLFEVMRELSGSGQLSFSPVTVGGTTVTFAQQPNPVFGRATVKPVHGMRSDLTCVVSPPPAGHPEYAVFLHAFGGQNGEYQINPDGFDESSNQSVPHIAMFTFDKNSAMFFGVPGVSKFGDVGILALVNEGIATQSGLLIDFNYTGAAS
jgi:hypothetical protein